MTKVRYIHRHPVKGLPAQSLETVDLQPGRGVPFDRHFAIVNGRKDVAPRAGTWTPSRTFLILTDDPDLARFDCQMSDDGKTLDVIGPDGAKAHVIAEDPSTYAAASQILAAHFGPGPHGMPELVAQAPGHGHWDFADTPVSIINLETVGQIAKAAERPLEKERFRGNLYIDGLSAWEEFAWPGSRLSVGDAELEVLRPIKRCAMTSTEPGTGRREIDVPKAMADAFGHIFCGVYARVVKPGRVDVKSKISVLTRNSFDPTADLPDMAPEPALWPQYAKAVAQRDGSFELQPERFANAREGQRVRVHAIGAGVASARADVINSTDQGWVISSAEPLPERVLVSGPFGQV